MKPISFLLASLLLLFGQAISGQTALAQAEDEAPQAPAAPEVGDEEPAAEPEPEVSDEEPAAEPEPEVSAPRPETSQPRESAAGLGREARTPTPAPARDSGIDLGPAQEESDVNVQESTDGDRTVPEHVQQDVDPDGDGTAEENPDTASRLAQANPNSGLPWALPINISQQLGISTLTRSRYLTYNPTYSWSLSAIPRWNFENGISVGIRQDLDIEFTESDITTEDRQLWWGDTALDVTYTLPWKPFGTLVIPSFLLNAPTSFISRSADRYLGPGGRLLLIKPIPVLGGLILGGGMSYRYWIGDHNGGSEPITGEGFPCERTGTSPANPNRVQEANCSNVGGPTPIRHVLSAGLFGTLIPANGWQINLSYTAIWNKGDPAADACFEASGMITCLPDNSETHWRTISSFSFSIGYDLASWITGSIGYNTLAFYPDSEGGLENPFFNELSQIFLSFQFRMDGMTIELRKERKAREEAAAAEAAANALGAMAF